MSTGTRNVVMSVMLAGMALSGCKCIRDLLDPEPPPQARPVPIAPHKPRGKPLDLPRYDTQVEWFSCTSDKECVHAPQDCCGCFHGGRDMAVNSKFFLAAGEVRLAGCKETQCVEQISVDPTCQAPARCLNGTCQLLPRGVENRPTPVAEPRPEDRRPGWMDDPGLVADPKRMPGWVPPAGSAAEAELKRQQAAAADGKAPAPAPAPAPAASTSGAPAAK